MSIDLDAHELESQRSGSVSPTPGTTRIAHPVTLSGGGVIYIPITAQGDKLVVTVRYLCKWQFCRGGLQDHQGPSHQRED